MKWTMLALTLLWVVVGQAQERYLTGDELLGYCKSSNEVEVAVCQGYLMGVVDGTTLKEVCKPEGTTAENLKELYNDYAHEHPEQLIWAAPTLVWNALIEAFPCG